MSSDSFNNRPLTLGVFANLGIAHITRAILVAAAVRRYLQLTYEIRSRVIFFARYGTRSFMEIEMLAQEHGIEIIDMERLCIKSRLRCSHSALKSPRWIKARVHQETQYLKKYDVDAVLSDSVPTITISVRKIEAETRKSLPHFALCNIVDFIDDKPLPTTEFKVFSLFNLSSIIPSFLIKLGYHGFDFLGSLSWSLVDHRFLGSYKKYVHGKFPLICDVHLSNEYHVPKTSQLIGPVVYSTHFTKKWKEPEWLLELRTWANEKSHVVRKVVFASFGTDSDRKLGMLIFKKLVTLLFQQEDTEYRFIFTTKREEITSIQGVYAYPFIPFDFVTQLGAHYHFIHGGSGSFNHLALQGTMWISICMNYNQLQYAKLMHKHYGLDQYMIAQDFLGSPSVLLRLMGKYDKKQQQYRTAVKAYTEHAALYCYGKEAGEALRYSVMEEKLLEWQEGSMLVGGFK